MWTLLASATLAMGVSADDAKTELGKMLEGMKETPSYEFTTTTTSDGGTGGGRGGDAGGRGGRGAEGGGRGAEGGGRGGEQGGARGAGGRGAGGRDAAGGPDANEPQVTHGVYRKGMPLHVKTAESEAFKDGDQFVFKGEDGAWTTMEEARGAGGGGRGDRGGRGGDAGGRGGMRGMRETFSLMRTQAPHAMLAGFNGKVADVAKSERDGKVVFSGSLTAEGAQGMQGGGMFSNRGGRGGGGGGPDFEYSGTFELVFDGAMLTTATFETSMKGSFRDRAIERSSKSVHALTNVGKVEGTIPDEVMAKFEI